ncbi:MAG: hypothetical protein ACYCWN_01460 [Ferrimicrobium sp.]
MRFLPLLLLELASVIIGLACFGLSLEALGVASSLSLIVLTALREVDGHFFWVDGWFVDPADALYFGLFPVPRWFESIAIVTVVFTFEWAVGIHAMPVLAKVGIVGSTLMLFVDIVSLRMHLKMKAS